MILVEEWRHIDNYANRVTLLSEGSCIAQNSTGRLVQKSPFSSVSSCLPFHPSYISPELRAMTSHRVQMNVNKALDAFHEHANASRGGSFAVCRGKAAWRSTWILHQEVRMRANKIKAASIICSGLEKTPSAFWKFGDCAVWKQTNEGSGRNHRITWVGRDL